MQHALFFVGKPEGKSPLGKLRCWWKVSVRMDVIQMECYGTNWIDLI
jgi:hypothetical protein